MDIQIKNLSVSFPSPQGDAKVLRDADIILKSGKITAIVGESGSGKSILGAAVMGLLEQPVRVSGEILFGDTDLLSLSEKELNSVRGSRVGWIAQDPVAAMDPMVKVGGQMMEGVHFYQDGNDTKADGIRQLEEFGLADAQRVWDTYPFHLSGGMAQRVLTAMMTLPGPEWLIADEPTKGLDAFVRRQAAGAFRKLREKGVGILLITHDLRLAERLSDFLAVMYAGEIIEYGKTKDTFSVVALFGLSVVVFAALRILPGDVASVMAGVNSPPERVTQLREQLGLNRPLIAQYFDWMSALARGDFGTSILTGRSVTSLVGARASITFPLIILGLLIALAIGLPLGCAAVLARSATVRAVFHVLAIVGGAVPALWGGLLLILLFGRGVGLLDVFPSQGFPLDGWGAPGSAISALVLPAVSVGIIVGASLMRYTRAALGDLASSGYIDMACSCGMTRTQAVLRVGLRLATPQLVSVIGLTFASMVTGVMVIENLFALPGIGNGLVTDVGNRDLIAVQSELFLLAAFFLTVGLVVDLLHRVLDPRLKTATAITEVTA